MEKAGFDAFAVGGAIRNLLLGKPVGDWDVATNAQPQEVMHLFSRVIPTGVAHGTVTVLVGKSSVEVTTFRGDLGYSDGRHPDRVVFLRSLKEDLRRRDFTINAMAYDLAKRQIIDPFHGKKDLQRKLIRAVGDPLQRFSEDGLRPLRAIRFACTLKFNIDKRTFSAIGGSLPTFLRVAPERTRDELLKILESEHSGRGIELLRTSGLLKVIIPEIIPLVGFPQNRFHRYNVFTHTLKSLDSSKRSDGVLKFAILLHDIGKPKVAAGAPGEYTFYGHEKVSAEMANTIMRRLRFSNVDRERVINLIENHMFHYEKAWTDGAVRRLVRRIGKEYLEDVWELRKADAWGRGIGIQDTLKNLKQLSRRIRKLLAKDSALKVTDLSVSGRDVMTVLGIEPGPRVGEILETLLQQVLDDPSLNTKTTLQQVLKRMKN